MFCKIGSKEKRKQENFCSVLSFVLLRYCRNRPQMCKNRLYFAIKCPFRSQIQSNYQAFTHNIPHPPLFEVLAHNPAYFRNFLFFILLFSSVSVSKKYYILCVFYMVLGIKIGCFCGIKNQGFRLGGVVQFLRIKIWLFSSAVRLYFCMSVYLYDLCVFAAQRALFCEFCCFVSFLRNLGVYYGLTLFIAIQRLQNRVVFDGGCSVCFAPALLLRGWYIRSIYRG